MATLKQIVFPIAVTAIAVAGYFTLNYFEEPIQEKESVDFAPLVKISPLKVKAHQINVPSQGMVTPKEQTHLVAQVSGQIVSISDKFFKGAFVTKGTVLMKIDPSDYQASLVEAQANLAAARAALQLEKARGHVAQSEWEKINNAKPSELGLRKPQLAQEVAKVRAAQAIVSKAQRNLERTSIRAPYDAIIGERKVSLGSVVNNGSSIGHLSATEVAQVRLPIADKDLAYLTNDGLGAKVELQGNFNGQPTTWLGRVVRNEGVIDSASRMHYLVVEVTNPYMAQKPLRFGNYITARISGKLLEQVVIIPRHLVVDSKLATVSAQSTLHFESVITLREEGDNVLVTGDFSKANGYITSALTYPVEGMTLSVKNTKDAM